MSYPLSDVVTSADNLPRKIDAVILFGRGMPRGEQEALFDQLALQLVEQGVAKRVESAFLEMTSPSLADRLQELAGQGLKRVAIVPAFAPYDRNVKRWLPRYLAFWKAERQLSLDLVIGPEIEATSSFSRGVCESIAHCDNASDVEKTHKPLRNRQGFSSIPEHARQVQVCLGPRCAMAGAWEIYDELRNSLQKHGLEKQGPGRVIPVRTACLQPCNFAPVCSVQPDNVWYGELTTDKVRHIVKEHLLEGKVVESLAYRPGDRLRSMAHKADMQDAYPVTGAIAGSIEVQEAFARPAMRLFDAGAVFMKILNTGMEDDYLIAVETPLSPKPRIHDATHSHRELMTLPFSTVTIPARGSVELQPGGLHMMLLQFRDELIEGLEVPLTLKFEHAGQLDLQLTLHPLPSSGGMVT